MSKKCTPLCRQAHFQVKMHKAPHCRTTFVSKPKCAKHTTSGPLLDVQPRHTTQQRQQGQQQLLLHQQQQPQLLELQLQLQHWNHSNINHSCSFNYTAIQLQLQLQLYTTPLHYTTLHFTTLHHASRPLHYNCNCNYNYNGYYSYSYSYNITTTTTSTTATTTLQLQLQLQLQIILCTTLYTTLHPAVVVEVTTATTPKNTSPTSFRSINGFALPSMHHNNSPHLKCPIFETSATALCGTTGTVWKLMINRRICVTLFKHEQCQKLLGKSTKQWLVNGGFLLMNSDDPNISSIA